MHSSCSSVLCVSLAALCLLFCTSTKCAEHMESSFSVEMCGVSMVIFSQTWESMNTACKGRSSREHAACSFDIGRWSVSTRWEKKPR